jgi:hypothetical protein
MDSSDESDGLIDELHSVVSKYLDTYVSMPALETVTKNVEGQARVASLGSLFLIVADSVKDHGIDYDKEYLVNLSKEEVKARIESFGKYIELQEASTAENNENVLAAAEYLSNDSSKKYLLEYLIRELKWIIVSLLSASYISSFVLMRSSFELTVGIATRETGGMTDRIHSIQGLDEEERKKVKNLWYRLCAWGHPYGKWQKEVCPIYVSCKPIYHPKLFSLCLGELIELIDFFVVIAIRKFELNTVELKRQLLEENISLADLQLLRSRLQA